jgi:predicted Zn finger-like uncharacterized protein
MRPEGGVHRFHMRVQCPDCTIVYDVPEHLLVGRKALRCARCGAEWTPGEPAPAPVENVAARPMQGLPATPPAGPASLIEPEAAPPIAHGWHEEQIERGAFSAMERLARPVEPQRRLPWAGMAWVGTLVVLGALAWGAVAWRADVMHAWPPSTRAYAALGLAPTSR